MKIMPFWFGYLSQFFTQLKTCINYIPMRETNNSKKLKFLAKNSRLNMSKGVDNKLDYVVKEDAYG